MSGADVACAEYERLALQMLEIQSGNFAEVKDAMRKIIASAPEGVDVAFVLSRALAHAADRACEGEVPSIRDSGSEGTQLAKGPDPAPKMTQMVLICGKPFAIVHD